MPVLPTPPIQLCVNHLMFPLTNSSLVYQSFFFSLYPYLYKLHVWAGIGSSHAFGCLTCGSLILGETSDCLRKPHDDNCLQRASGKDATFGLHWCKEKAHYGS